MPFDYQAWVREQIKFWGCLFLVLVALFVAVKFG